MDKTARGILSLGIAILLPTFIYFAVVTFLPEVSAQPAGSRPEAPNCQQRKYDYELRRYSNDEACMREYDEYNLAQREYNRELKEVQNKAYETNNQRDLLRAQTALILALMAMFSILWILSIKELVVGISAGAAITIFVAVSLLMSEEVSRSGLSLISDVLVLAAFVSLTGLVYVLDRLLPPDEEPKDPAPVDAPPVQDSPA